MKSIIYTKIVITSILAFALIVATGISTTAFVNVFAQGEGGDTGGMSGDEGGMTGGGSNTTDGAMTNGGTGTTDGTIDNSGP